MKLSLNNFSLNSTKNKTLFTVNQITFKKGFLNVISGESGTGKTTFFNALINNYSSYSGDILVNQKKIDNFSKNNISYSFVPADLSIIPEFTVLEFLHIVTIEDVKIDNLLKDLSIYQIKNQVLSKCSRGEQVRVEICAALLKNSDIYLFDEPTANLDLENKKLIFKVLNDWSINHLVIIASHDFDLITYDYNLWEIKDSKLSLIKKVDEDDILELKNNNTTNKNSKFPYFKFIIKKSFNHKLYFGFSLLFLCFFLISSFLSVNLNSLDKNKTFSSAIDNLPYNYNGIYKKEKNLELDENCIFTTEAEIQNIHNENLNITCYEDLDDETKSICSNIFENYNLSSNQNSSDYIHPIILTSEQIDYFKQNKIEYKVGDYVSITLEQNIYAVSHTPKKDSFILAGIIDYKTDIDKGQKSISSCFPAIIKRDEYIKCLRHSGIRTKIFTNSIKSIIDDYNRSTTTTQLDTSGLEDFYYNILSVSDFNSIYENGSITFYNEDSNDDCIYLPEDFETISLILNNFSYSNYIKNHDSNDENFYNKYIKDNKIFIPISNKNNLVPIDSFYINGYFSDNSESILTKDCIVVSDSLFNKIIDQIKLGYKDYNNLSVFANKTYLKENLNYFINENYSLYSNTWSACLLAYNNALTTSKFVLVVTIIICIISFIFSSLYGINEFKDLQYDFGVIRLLGISKKFCFKLFSLLILFISSISYLISLCFSNLFSNLILSSIAKHCNFSGSLVTSNFCLAYVYQFILLIIFIILVLLISILGKRKYITQKIKEKE